MGLGFAAMGDPQSGQNNPVVAQFLSIVGTLLFLAIGGHLALAAIVVESYRALPPGDAWLSAESLYGLVTFGGVLFAAGLSIALPVGFAIVPVQIVRGLLARSAPALNLGRKTVVSGTSVSVRVDTAGRRLIKKKRQPTLCSIHT